MGLGPSNYISEAELSDDEMNVPDPDFSNTLDAMIKPSLAGADEDILSFKKLSAIEDQLDDFEIISLIYLLCESSEFALEILNKFNNSTEKRGLLYEWAKSEKIDYRKRQKKLVEALCIVQNYQILSSLGYDKRQLQGDYMPGRAETCVEVSKTRKIFYLIAEKLTKEQTSKFINNMNRKLREANLMYPECDYNYIEFYFLYWEHINVNIKDIQKALKTIDLDVVCDYLDHVPERAITLPSNETSLKPIEREPKVVSKKKTITTKDNTYLAIAPWDNTSSMLGMAPGSSLENASFDNKYPIDPSNPGVVLIINQKEFFTEPDIKYQHLLHENKEAIQLPSRIGTEMDRDRLNHVFFQMGFNVIVYDNLPHFKMLATIKDVIDGVSEESSLIICILSHGDEGVVYGSNSCKVSVLEIKRIMCKRSRKLAGKPKVLILQSCQGEKCQRAEEDDASVDDGEDDNANNAIDGPTRRVPIVDLMTFWATIPGYAAIRNMTRGSWFIQALCDEIEFGHSMLHFYDICTRAVKKVTHKEWIEESWINVMTPLVESTLTQSFFLPPFKAS